MVIFRLSTGMREKPRAAFLEGDAEEGELEAVCFWGVWVEELHSLSLTF